jgi:2-iminobutanoate/2-iminopropanoate deaminase
LFHESNRIFAKGNKLNRWMTCGVALLATVAAGCESMGGRGWVPQGPGDYSESRPPRTEAPKPVAATRPTSPAATQPPVAAATAGAAPTAAAPAPRASAAGPALASSPGAYTQATRYGDLLFISGQIALDLNTSDLKGTSVEEQTRQIMENIRTILESHRLTQANVVSVTVYLKDLHDFRPMDAAYETYFRSALPARSVVEVSRLPRDAKVEIAVIAGR